MFLATVPVLTTVPSAMAKPLILEPTSAWQINYDDDGCRLARTFGTGKDQVILMLDRYQPDTASIISVIGKPFADGDPVRTPVTVTFGPDLPPGTPRESLVGTIGKDKLPILMMGYQDLINREVKQQAQHLLPTPDQQKAIIEQEKAITELTIRAKGRTVVLHIRSLGAPMQALRTCTTDLVKHWGLDPAEQAGRTRLPTPTVPPRLWLRTNDYPERAVSKMASAIIDFRLMVDSVGMPTDCHIQRMTKGDDFPTATCKLLMERARFIPALGADGKPIASYYASSVRWVMSDDL